MNNISVKVTVKETGIGVPDLLVVVYDLDREFRSEDGFAGPGDRIGSVLTGPDGTCSIIYDDSEFQIRDSKEKRPDLQLSLLGPEDADSEKPPTVLFSSKLLRLNSGRTESYLIRLTEKQLVEAGIAVPTDKIQTAPAMDRIEAYRSRKTEERAIKVGIKQVNEQFENEDRVQDQDLRSHFKAAILPKREILDRIPNLVKENETIEETQKRVLNSGAVLIDDRINLVNPSEPRPGRGMKVALILTDEEKAGLEEFAFDFDGRKYFNLPEAEINKILFKREADGGINSILFSDNPISKFCLQKSAGGKCAGEATGLFPEPESGTAAETEGSEGDDGDQPGAMEDEDVAVYLRRILDGDGTQNQGGIGSKRADSATIQKNVDKFMLQKGPADTTAYYDFHSLQIAFDHVWQQLLDESVVSLGQQIHTAQETGGKKGILQSIRDQVTMQGGVRHILPLLQEAQFVLSENVPTEISTAFDISYLEYDNLASPDKARLLELATDINKFESIGYSARRVDSSRPWWNGFFGNSSASDGPTIDYATQASVLREQGERIIDNVRINKPFSTNQMLKELTQRLLGKYEFTVFAADKDYHSVNFGLLNTYRQKWEPISYQAGKLVKTIPLSPKEERKYSLKTTVNTKITRKQATKNNSSLQQEINTTSRAESEIVAKAQDKSNFHMSVKLDYSKISSEVGFGKDAEKESSQAKKDFREAVIKAAQEFKEERSLEVDAEESYGSEYNESGTIVNPNDELSVTYLFYELQRRYRVSEQLHRVMPVVLVAQEVPAPDQITEAWVVAHDWILNRFLLDDSFRPTLEYIGQKSVGEDFAIRELRKNLRAQRTLVNRLQIEFSKLRVEADNRYKVLEDAVGDRIQSEHDKRFYKYRWYWTAFGPLQGAPPGPPPDPEMAKAQELAATDAQKHAAEQVERMALSVQREVNALHQLTTEYNAVMKEHLDRITQVRRLVTHIKENILYYMQAIWSMEPPDQRFMRLYKVNVPYFEAERFCVVSDAPVPGSEDPFMQFRPAGKRRHDGWLGGRIKRNADAARTPVITQRQLVEVADLDTFLGFKGNYMIFPLKEHNALTELMAAPYIDESFGAMDPDQFSNVNLEEYAKYVCCLHKSDPDKFEELKPVLKEWLRRLLADPLRNGDEIVVPTGSLFIEMLPSSESLLEDFKLMHREMDVEKVREEVKKLALENVRYAARLLKNERGDPDVEKKIVIEGNITPNIDVGDN